MKFTIRDILWLTVVVGLTVGWVKTARRMDALESEFAKLRGEFIPVGPGPVLKIPPGMIPAGGGTFGTQAATPPPIQPSGQPYIVSEKLVASDGPGGHEQWAYTYSDGSVVYETKVSSSSSHAKK